MKDLLLNPYSSDVPARKDPKYFACAEKVLMVLNMTFLG
jgi:hypothetical protein